MSFRSSVSAFDAAGLKGVRRHDFRTFLLLWSAQSGSLLGSAALGFALGVWTLEQTGSPTHFALITLFATLPSLLLAPLAGVLVDRWDRRWAMITGDLSGAVMTALLYLLYLMGRLEVWHLYVAVAVASIGGSLQQPAFAATVPLLVQRHHLGRAAGLVQSAEAATRLLAPLLGGLLLAAVALRGALLLDMVTALAALLILWLLRLPRPSAPSGGGATSPSFLRQLPLGWRYIRNRPGLLLLLLLFATVNLAFGMVQVLLPPLVLNLSDVTTLGLVLSLLSGGFLGGSLILTITGGPQRRVRAILVLVALQGVLLMLAGLRPSVALITGATMVFMAATALIHGSSQVIWQSKVEPGMMGRVFAIRRMVALSTLPVAYLVAGPLAEHVFEPIMAPGGEGAILVGGLLGIGQGRGIGLLFLLLGALTLATALLGAAHPRLRGLEEEVPDGSNLCVDK